MAEISLNEFLQQIDGRKAEVDALRPFTQEQEARIMQKFRLDWNYHSNAIEGNSLTYGETIAFLMEGLTAKGKPFKDHLDIKGHNEGIDYLMHFVQNREQLTEKVIRELHKMILVEAYTSPAKTSSGQIVDKKITLGAYKSMPNHVKTPTGETHFYATPEETPAKMTDLVAWLHRHQKENDLHPLILAATFHHRFVAIHPFDDGNGRMSRLLMNLILMQYGYPPVVIKQQDRQAYYYALRQADAGDLSSFIEYIGENLLHSLDIQLKGAKGESLEEEDDLDKEIALLKVSIGEPVKAISKNYKILQETSIKILDLFETIQKQCNKLNDLFFGSEDKVFYSKDKRSIRKIELKNWNKVKSKGLLQHPEHGSELSEVSYQYQWVELRKVSEAYTISCELTVRFYQYNYEIEFSGIYEKLKVLKQYGQDLSQEEIQEISKIFVIEALARIKDYTKQGF